MRATFTDEQRSLAETADDLAANGRSAARALLDGGDLPRQPTASLLEGFSGLGVGEDAGGAGGDLVDLGIVLHGLGRQVTPTPWVAHSLAIQVAHAVGIDVTRAASGEETWTLAVEERDRAWDEWTVKLDGTVTGDKVAVRGGPTADVFVVLCADDRVALVTSDDRTERDAMDPTRPLADVTFAGEPRGQGSGATAALRRATAALSAELVGVGRGAVDLAVEYAKVREQFGQAIGRFQGVAHQLADVFTDVELAWSSALYACWAVDAGVDDAAIAVHAAKSKAGEAAKFAAERCTQVHGGIGITWEADPHLYLRRAVADDAWLGSARTHRQRLGRALITRR